MPLKCLRGDDEIFAFEVDSSEAWSLLREENSASRTLRMPCCGAGVVLRTSKLGTKHFAHALKGPCSTAPESAEHLLAKRTIVDGIRKTQWSAKTEQRGETPSAEKWTADVLAIRGNAKVAFEVQWSRQGGEETFRRQDKYEAAGVRGLWLFRQHDFVAPNDFLPAFRLLFDARKKVFSVALPSPEYDPRWIGTRDKDSPLYWSQVIELAKFAAGAVSGKLRFAPSVGLVLPLDVFASTTKCERCKSEVFCIANMFIAVSKVLPGHPDIPLPLGALDVVYGGSDLINKWLPPLLLKKYKIGAIKARPSRLDVEKGAYYLSNGCFKCDARLARNFHDKLPNEEHEVSLSVNIPFEAAFASQLPNSAKYVDRWWFDESP